MYRSTFHYTRPYLLLLFSLSSFFLLAQKPAQLDSLQQVLAQSVDTSKVKALINIAYAWERIDPTKGLPYSQQAIGLAQEINYEKGLGDAYYAAGYLYHLKDDHPKAEKLYSQAVSVYQDINDEKKLSECYGRLGHLYTLRAEYQRSLEIYEKALEITKRTKDNRNASIIIFSMANSYAYIGESQKAFQLLKECKPLIVHRPHLINYYAILADLYRGTGNHEKSLASFSEAINICEEFGDTLRMAYVSEAIARTYSELGQYENGAAYYFKTIALNEKIASPVLTIVSYLGLGDLYRLWKDPKKSIEFYQQARIMIDSNQIMEKLPVFHLGMGQSYSDLKAYPLALQHFEQALTVAEESQLLEEMIKARIFTGAILVKLGRYEKAMNMLSQTIPKIPMDWQNDCLQADLYQALGQGYLQQRQYTQSIIHLKEGLSFAQACGNLSDLEQFYADLSEASQKTNNFQNALAYHQKYAMVHDSLLQAKNSQELLAMRTQFETEEKEKAIHLLQKEQKLQSLILLNQKSELRRKEFYLIGLLLIVGTGALLFWLFFNRFKLKKRAEQLEMKNQKIELEQKHLKASQQLEMAKLRSGFFTDLSHELRTPLSLILSPIEELLEKNHASPQRPSYELMHRNAQRLLNLVDQTLEVSKLKNGQLPLESIPCNLADMIERLIEQFTPFAQQKGIQLQLINESSNLLFSCDQDKMEKAISNLLKNAVEHSQTKGWVTVQLQEAKKDRQLLIKITDKGKGIPAVHLPYLFDRFYQVDQYSKKGTGIGLALTKQVIELHQGSIEVESQLNQGSCFTIRLPLPHSSNDFQEVKKKKGHLPNAISDPPSPNKNVIKETISTLLPPPNKVLSGVEILIVEDNPDFNQYLSRRLSERGYKVNTAMDGFEALTYLSQHLPKLIISDVMMPNMDGFELLQRVKKDLRTAHIPIILLTAKVNQADKMEGLEFGAEVYLTKPFHMDELLLRSQNLILQRKQLKEAFLRNSFGHTKTTITNKVDENFLNQALDIVENRMEDAEFNVEKFCREIGMSRTNLYNKLKALTGQNISNFIRTIRLRKAAKLIEDNSGNIIEIASRVGFNTRQSFNKSFKDFYGVSPSEFKKERRKVNGQ